MTHRFVPIKLSGPFATRELRDLYWAAGLSALGGVIHAGFAPEHFQEWFGYGAFFVIVALAQLALSVLLLSPKRTRSLLLAGVVGNLLILVLYTFTRTLGIPLGPHAGEIEPFGALDALATISEAALILYLALLLKRWRSIEQPPILTA